MKKVEVNIVTRYTWECSCCDSYITEESVNENDILECPHCNTEHEVEKLINIQ